MSIVIPAADLTRTVITIRCDSPNGAPQVECALDEQTTLKQQQQHQRHPLPAPLDTEGASLTRSSSSSSLSMDSPRTPAEFLSAAATATASTRADLNVERGLDQRGHFVRLCFSSMARSQSGGFTSQETGATGSYFPPSYDMGLAHNSLGHSPAGAGIYPGFPTDMDMDVPDLMSDMPGPVGASINLESPHRMLDGISDADFDNLAYAFPHNAPLMSALDIDSFLNELDISQTWDDFSLPSTSVLSDTATPATPAAAATSGGNQHHHGSYHQQRPNPTSQFCSAPASPEMLSPTSSLSSSSSLSLSLSSSPSTSSGTNSPGTPYDFFTPTPSSTPTSEFAMSPGGHFYFAPGVGPDTAFVEALGSASANKAFFSAADMARPLQGPMPVPGVGLGAAERPITVSPAVAVASAADAHIRSPSHTPPQSQPQSPFQSHSLVQGENQTQTQVSCQPTPRLLPCPQPGCRRQFKSTSTLSGHLKTHAGKGTRFACSFLPCTEKFSRRHDQLRHEVYKHGKRCEWVCPRCSSFFSYERSLEKHTCTMDKSRRGSAQYAAGSASEAATPTPDPVSASGSASAPSTTTSARPEGARVAVLRGD